MNWGLLCHESVLFAIFGAIGMQLLNLMELRNVPKKQRYQLKDFFFWLPFFVAPFLGALLALAYIYSGDTLKPLAAINVGAFAPLILRSLANSNPFDTGGIKTAKGA